ncbi:putative mitochondrial protein [Andalucia godoyi]|uniref:Putative mitochondrial protein n=1 Tax=Andalucia godoyi TaxID=505711 RepID=A0A8K0AFX2_ANDGO|nr:putative mitochondrial protein [Andalucia godoyi]|eukprot:ANDGO_08798.mRNA.1 putative mitochondrial protein
MQWRSCIRLLLVDTMAGMPRYFGRRLWKERRNGSIWCFLQLSIASHVTEICMRSSLKILGFFGNDEIRQYWDDFVKNGVFDSEHFLEEELFESELYSATKPNRRRRQQTQEKPTSPVADAALHEDGTVILVNPAPVVKSKNSRTNREAVMYAPQNALTEFAFRGKDVFTRLDANLDSPLNSYGVPSGNPKDRKFFLWKRRHRHYDLAFVELTLSVQLRTFP